MADIITGDIGGRLRRARKERGLSLLDAAGRTKLSIGVLQAIERNDFESLPGGIYRKGYLRSLAGEVGLDPKEIAADYDREFEPIGPATAADRSAVPEHKWGRQLTLSPRGVFVPLVILIALSIGWLAWPGPVEQALAFAKVAGELFRN
jgi:cytoskeleton protein RodZ